MVDVDYMFWLPGSVLDGDSAYFVKFKCVFVS